MKRLEDKLLKNHIYLLDNQNDGTWFATVKRLSDGSLWFQEYILVDKDHPHTDPYGIRARGGLAWIKDGCTVCWKHDTYGFGFVDRDTFNTILRRCEPLPTGLKPQY